MVACRYELVSAWSDLHDNEVRCLPCKGRVLAPILLSLLTFDTARRSAPLVQPPVPRQFHGQVGSGVLQPVEAPERTPPDDDFERRFRWILRLPAFRIRHQKFYRLEHVER